MVLLLVILSLKVCGGCALAFSFSIIKSSVFLLHFSILFVIMELVLLPFKFICGPLDLSLGKLKVPLAINLYAEMLVVLSLHVICSQWIKKFHQL